MFCGWSPIGTLVIDKLILGPVFANLTFNLDAETWQQKGQTIYKISKTELFSRCYLNNNKKDHMQMKQTPNNTFVALTLLHG